MTSASATQPRAGSRWTGRMLVLVIILAAGALAFALAVFRKQNQASVNDGTSTGRARADILYLQSQLRSYLRVTGTYPTEQEGLEALVKARLLRAVPTDPWDRPYLYRIDRGVGRVLSLGRDGTEGGVGDDADVDSSFRDPKPSDNGAG